MCLTSAPRWFSAIVLGAVLAGASHAAAQVIYEPVQSQYQYNGKAFYYGGHDPQVLDFAAGDIERTSYTSVATSVHVVHRQRVYSDRIPFENLADNSRTSYRSFTAADAQNEANAQVPLYFRKRDLLRAAQVDIDGTLVVPSDAQPRVDVKVRVPAAVGPRLEKGTILIIPEKMLQQRSKDGSSVAIAK